MSKCSFSIFHSRLQNRRHWRFLETFSVSPCCDCVVVTTQRTVLLVGTNFDKYFDYIDEDTKTTVWLCHLEGQQGREDEVEDVGI